jgi:hypothetical protein
MSKLNLIDFLSTVKDYVLIKRSEEFPDYTTGSDIDLLVMDCTEAIRAIHSYYNSNFGEFGELRVTENKDYLHADLLFNDALDIRIDLIDNFNYYTKFSVRQSFLIKIFRDRLKQTFNDGVCFVPSPEDDLTIRYFEYLEYFENRPDKVKHLDYICSIDNDQLKQLFFENTHRFISFKRKTWNSNIDSPHTGKDALKMISLGSRFLLSSLLKKSGLER